VVDPVSCRPYYPVGLMTFHFLFPRLLCSMALLAWLSMHTGTSATQNPEDTHNKTAASIAHFTDMAAKAGLATPVIFGGENKKKYIIENHRYGRGDIRL